MSMCKSIVPYGGAMIDKQSLNKKSLELPLGSPLTFFIQISLSLMLSKFK